MKRATVIAVATMGLLALVGCGKPQTGAMPKATYTAPVFTYAPTAAPTPESADAVCSNQAGQRALYESYKEAWSAKAKSCNGQAFGSPTKVELAALNTAYSGNYASDADSARNILYGMCAQNDISAWSYLSTAGSASQVAEVKGMLTLCPEHPLAGQLKGLISKAEGNQTLKDSGKIFNAGVLRVGTEVQPGTYVASYGKGCYWERQDRNGNIIDNGFYTDAARIQVTIKSTDYAFMSRSCGDWKPA